MEPQVRKITRTDLWKLEPFCISVLLRSLYDTLPTPANSHKWVMREDPQCKLCGERGTMAHILADCKTALTLGRYRWLHDKMLMILAYALEQERCKKLQTHGKPTHTIEVCERGSKNINHIKNNK